MTTLEAILSTLTTTYGLSPVRAMSHVRDNLDVETITKLKYSQVVTDQFVISTEFRTVLKELVKVLD